MNDDKGLIMAYTLDGKGGGQAITWNEIANWSTDDNDIWIHLDYSSEDAKQWLLDESGLDEVVVTALTGDDPRPRSAVMNDGMLVILRGINLNPGADPEDMVSMRLWIDGHRVISTRRRKLLATHDLSTMLERGQGPTSPGDFLVEIADHLAGRMSEVVNDVDEMVDSLEDQVLTVQSHLLRPQLAELRREAIGLRRYLAPQREAMARLYNERVPWLSDIDRMHLREVADRTTRYIEDLDAARERAIVIQEELASRISEQMDQRMYVLSVIAAIFLPLGFLTGLLGINVGGIPGADYKWSFLIFCLVLLAMVYIQILIFKKMRWL